VGEEWPYGEWIWRMAFSLHVLIVSGKGLEGCLGI